MVATHDAPLSFRYGPKTFVVVALSSDAYSNAYDFDLIKEFN
ncbi:hypothetical protein ACR6HW_13355 [Fusibacter sp. JL298sf-3]